MEEQVHFRHILLYYFRKGNKGSVKTLVIFHRKIEVEVDKIHIKSIIDSDIDSSCNNTLD